MHCNETLMKKILFHLIRYTTILFPIIFLIIVLAHTNYYTDRNRVVTANYPIEQYQQKKPLSSIQLPAFIHPKPSKASTGNQITHNEWQNIIHQITAGNNEWTQSLPKILPYTPIKLRQALDQAILHALQTKPSLVLQSLALTDYTLKNTNMICKAVNLNQNEKLHLATLLRSVHDPSFIYQQQSCLHALLKTMKQKQHIS